MDKNKLKLLFLLLIAALPIGLATWSFGVREQQGVSATSNKGVLITPVLDVTALDLRDAEGQPAYVPFDELVAGVDPDDYEPRPWQLLYLGTADCDLVCQERLYFLRQLHTRLAGEKSRVARVYVHVGQREPLPPATLATLAEQQPDMRVVTADAASLQQHLARTVQPGQDPVSEHYIYVVDPVGNIMLYFTPGNTPEQILDDLDKLLDQSSLG